MYSRRNLMGSHAVAILVLLLDPVCGWATARADETPPRLTLAANPSRVVLEPGSGEERQVLLVAANPGLAPVAVAHLAHTATPGLHVDVTPQVALPANGDLSWLLSLRAEKETPAESSVEFRLEYSVPSKSETTVIRASLPVAVVPVQVGIPVTAFKVSLQGDSEKVQELQDGLFFLTVENLSDTDLQLHSIDTFVPSFLSVVGLPALPFTIGSGALSVFPFAIRAGDQPLTGDHVALLRIALKQGSRTSQILLSQKVSVGVPGLTEALQLLDLPTFFIVPGVLVLLLCGVFWQASHAPGENVPSILVWRTPQFWAVAIGLAIATARYYPIATALLLGERRNFLAGLGITDVAFLWLGSIGISPFIYVGSMSLIWSATRCYARLKTAYLDRWRPVESDKPQDIICKLRRLGLKLDLRSSTRGHQCVFIVGDSSGEQCWVIPRILVTKGEPEPTTQELTDVDNAVDEPGNPAYLDKLIDTLRAATKRGSLKVEWEKGPVQSPSQVRRSELVETRAPESLVKRL